jgi:hypothetical protein
MPLEATNATSIITYDFDLASLNEAPYRFPSKTIFQDVELISPLIPLDRMHVDLIVLLSF